MPSSRALARTNTTAPSGVVLELKVDGSERNELVDVTP